MALATVDPTGLPSCRFVLLRGLDARGLRLFSNYQSDEGQHLTVRPVAAATFWWSVLERQVRVAGDVEQLPAAESDARFRERPRAMQLSAWSSPQSAEIASRAELERRVRDVERRFAAAEHMPRPPFWGGYLLRPASFEFWQGRGSRRHDRLVYRSSPSGGWNVGRLAP